MQNQMTIIMVIIGAAIICLVLIYNFWQAQRIKQQRRQRLATSETEALPDTIQENFDQDYSVPVTASETADSDMPSSSAEPDVAAPNTEDAILSETAPLQQQAHHQASDQQPDNSTEQTTADNITQLNTLPSQVSREVDSIVKFNLTGQEPHQLLQSLQLPEQIKQPYKIFLQADLGEWHLSSQLQNSATYKALVISVQLVTRDGPISVDEIQYFTDWIEDLQQKLQLSPVWITHTTIEADANALDQFCLSVDKTLKIHLMHGSSGRFTGTKFRGLAESSGLTLNQGVYLFENTQGDLGYTLANMELNPFNPEMLRTVVLKGVTFQLDIPRTKQCSVVFDHMLSTAKKMETALNAVLVDEQMRELSDLQLERIGQQIKLIETQMHTRGMPAGGDVALRLFN